MGVTGLWNVLQPCARPVKLETLNKKRLAIDASIWIYQFLKAVRDKEGNALRNSHVVGFFRRICKLLFFGIKPIFVFDGGAPALKRQTILGRKQRREGRREDAVRTAGKLLAVQMQRRAEEEHRRRKDASSANRPNEEEEKLPEELVYVDELQMTPQERRLNRQFKKKDAYHLPDLDVSLTELGAPGDPRVMSQEELEEYARQFHRGEDINLYDFSNIDFNSPFFLSLPASDRYNILNAARLRSRLRMGYSKDQLDSMFPDRMAFSKFQIERVKERNDLTQRLMNLNGMNGTDADLGLNATGRVEGERGREYVLVKNDGAEGGWALGVVGSADEGKSDKPIDVEVYDQMAVPKTNADEEADDEDGFEDVPIEGLNRLPKHISQARPSAEDHFVLQENARRREEFYSARKRQTGAQPTPEETDGQLDTLFIPEDEPSQLGETHDLFHDGSVSDEEEQLQRAIQLSLQPSAEGKSPADLLDMEDDDLLNFDGGNEVPSASKSPAIAAPRHLEAIADDQDDLDMQSALAESRSNQAVSDQARSQKTTAPPTRATSAFGNKPAAQKFDGPLPFKRLEFGKSMLRKKQPEKEPDEEAGGFEKGPAEEEEKAQPLPPWFAGDVAKDLKAAKDYEKREAESAREHDIFGSRNEILLNKPKQREVIDLDEEEKPAATMTRPIELSPSSSPKPRDKVDASNDAKPSLPTSAAHEVHKSPEIPPAHQPAEPSSPKSVSEESLQWENVAEEGEPAPQQQEPVDLQPLEQADYDFPPPSPNREVDHSYDHAPEYLQPAAGAGEDVVEDAGVYSDDAEEDELMQQLAQEAEEHARFASSLNNHRSQFQDAADYERELKQLRSQQSKDRRDADEITQIMITECQQLLKLFGLPYITAPMEAEAQCAELVSLGLVDGIVTDDSDIFLFGGTRVYKNMFNQAKFVECYLSSDLEKELDLDRNRLIRLAHLLGSDYTEGLPSVGPVTALEILSEFDSLEGFKDWWTIVQSGLRNPSAAATQDTASPFRRRFRRNATKLFLPPTFPDQRVDYAYLNPEIDSDPSSFVWGMPDLDALRSFLMATIGWSQARTDEILVPVIRDMNRREVEGTQANITNFFSGSVGAGAGAGAGVGTGGSASASAPAQAFAPRRRKEAKSKRMEDAWSKLQQRAKKRRKGNEDGD
ncbi:PIN domain-like protein [Xylona heveae TC161]|uniref:PIN domain-like protein n=1 Tax=Xylona heveae (strain CBS 132557 / TC161) TaxID=1328760 RepID=A0A161TPM1_XYLHT|nr:PIN domain-like protein [Xylona heveae TC161]KZF24176.1 PIN domain-like protein [Xylona heveae TC161]